MEWLSSDFSIMLHYTAFAQAPCKPFVTTDNVGGWQSKATPYHSLNKALSPQQICRFVAFRTKKIRKKMQNHHVNSTTYCNLIGCSCVRHYESLKWPSTGEKHKRVKKKNLYVWLYIQFPLYGFEKEMNHPHLNRTWKDTTHFVIV